MITSDKHLVLLRTSSAACLTNSAPPETACGVVVSPTYYTESCTARCYPLRVEILIGRILLAGTATVMKASCVYSLSRPVFANIPSGLDVEVIILLGNERGWEVTKLQKSAPSRAPRALISGLARASMSLGSTTGVRAAFAISDARRRSRASCRQVIGAILNCNTRLLCRKRSPRIGRECLHALRRHCWRSAKRGM